MRLTRSCNHLPHVARRAALTAAARRHISASSSLEGLKQGCRCAALVLLANQVVACGTATPPNPSPLTCPLEPPALPLLEEVVSDMTFDVVHTTSRSSMHDVAGSVSLVGTPMRYSPIATLNRPCTGVASFVPTCFPLWGSLSACLRLTCEGSGIIRIATYVSQMSGVVEPEARHSVTYATVEPAGGQVLYDPNPVGSYRIDLVNGVVERDAQQTILVNLAGGSRVDLSHSGRVRASKTGAATSSVQISAVFPSVSKLGPTMVNFTVTAAGNVTGRIESAMAPLADVGGHLDTGGMGLQIRWRAPCGAATAP
jgi:hypothetical protein